MSTQQTRIGILGTGAIGGFYGLMLARAGFEVHFLARSEYDTIKTCGLTVESTEYGILHLHPVNVWADVHAMPLCDWVLVATKTTSNADLAPILNAMTQKNGKVVLMQNGLAVEDRLRPLLREDIHLLGGLCFICVHRSRPGVVIHQAYGGINLGCHVDNEQGQQIAEQGAALFKRAGLASQATNLAQARWQKLVWNIPYNGLSVVLNTSTSALMTQASSRVLIMDLMHEVTQAAVACGQQLSSTLIETMLQSTERMPDYFPSMYHDFAHKRPLELDSIYREPLAAAQTAGINMPKVQMLLQMLEFMTR